MTKHNNQIHNFCVKINTNDAQKAELKGMHKALQLASQIESKDTTVLCDCKMQSTIATNNTKHHLSTHNLVRTSTQKHINSGQETKP